MRELTIAPENLDEALRILEYSAQKEFLKWLRMTC